MRWCFFLFSTRKHERAAVLVCTAVWRPAHLPACPEHVTCHTGTPKGGLLFWGEGANLLGLVVHVHIIDTVQSSIKPHLPTTIILGRCWIGVSPSQTKYKAVLRKVLSAFYCELKVLASSFHASYLRIKNFKLFWVALENLFAVKA